MVINIVVWEIDAPLACLLVLRSGGVLGLYVSFMVSVRYPHRCLTEIGLTFKTVSVATMTLPVTRARVTSFCSSAQDSCVDPIALALCA